ncbi:MAG TPA: hypothetical protein VGB59_00810 [Allosphingosinicella sp.]|jgi:hypothetical protein
MEKKYWIGRKRASMAMARGATGEARLIHYELAGLYSIRAAQSAAAGETGGSGEGAMLHLPNPSSLELLPPDSRHEDGFEARRDPERSREEGR